MSKFQKRFTGGAEIFLDNPFYDWQGSAEINPEKYLQNDKSSKPGQSRRHLPLYIRSLCVVSSSSHSCIFLLQLKYFTLHSEKHWEKGRQNTWKLTATEELTSSQMVYPKLLLVKTSEIQNCLFPPKGTHWRSLVQIIY